MKKLHLVLILCLISCAAFAGPEPAPWWKNVEDTQNLLIKWITALTVIGTALITALGGLALLIRSKMKDLKDRQDQATTEKAQLQAQVVDLAKQTPPVNPSTNPPTK